jgi:hypothetical protein
MKSMSLTLACILIAQISFLNNIYSQKKWDGGGGDSLWNNPYNWQPDGVPKGGDTVVLDNQWILSNYHVLLPDSMVTANAYAIRIQPAYSYEINLIIPSTNTAAPALMLGALDTAIFIGEGGSLLNNSGANAGNTILITGKFKIANGGKYVHQTLRGNTLLISNLVNGADTQKGIFEFNVPGNSAYTISASGRTFGSLVLNGQNTTRKTYSSSGSNKLTIEGDFIIQEQAGYSSSLTNNISIGGDLIIKGRLFINPVSGDTTGRCLESNGANQLISIPGLFNQGVHFRKWMINGNYRMQNSIINIEHPTGLFHITPSSYIDMGSCIIKGAGKVKVDSNTNIATSARTIIGIDSMSNIQTEQLDIYQKVGFVCYGPITQSTGERFPSRISKLQLTKSKEKLYLTKSITIQDSLLLSKGIITLPDTAAITIGNYTNPGNDSSFITGSVIQSSKKLELIFPTGIDSVFAPARITRNTESIKEYAIKVSRFSLNDSLLQTHPPVEKITSKMYWEFEQSDISQSDGTARLEILNNQHENLSCITAFDTVDNKWKLPPNTIVTLNNNVLSANISMINKGKLTIGTLEQHVLPLNNILLKQMNSREGITLLWSVNDDANAQYYLIEQSKDGSHFESKDSIVSAKYKGQMSYKKILMTLYKNMAFFRVSGIDLDGNKYHSNIVHAQSRVVNSSIYPNPNSNRLYIKTQQKIIAIKIVHPSGKVASIIPMQDDVGYYLSTASLSSGNYFLQIVSTRGLETLTFLKQ